MVEAGWKNKRVHRKFVNVPFNMKNHEEKRLYEILLGTKANEKAPLASTIKDSLKSYLLGRDVARTEKPAQRDAAEKVTPILAELDPAAAHATSSEPEPEVFLDEGAMASIRSLWEE